MSAFADREALEKWLLDEKVVTSTKASTAAATLISRGYDSPLSLLGITIQELKDYAGIEGPVARELSNALSKQETERGGRPPLPPISPTQQQQVNTDELTKVLKTMSISLHTIQETLPSVLSGHVVTPSTASRHRQRSACIFDAVGLALRPTEVEREYNLPPVQQNIEEWTFNWKWPSQSGEDSMVEQASYLPVRDFLRRLGYLAEDVSEGRNCVNKLLCSADIYSVRQEDPNRVRRQKVYYRHRVEGRTYLVVLTKSRQGGEILRNMVRLAVEIKTVKGLKQSTDGCMFEAQLQLVGLNAFNTSNSPPVVLTNLATTHCVLHLAYEDDGWSYVIKKQNCATFPAAIHFAILKSGEEPISANCSRR